ncbi:MAG: hypothetical protein WAU36_04225 [Cyclobacteriaceae bacterium]
MKKLILGILPIAIAVSCISIDASAQYSRLKNSSSSQLGIGFTDAGFMLNAYYVKTYDQKVRAGFGGGLVFGKISDISYKSVFVDGLGSYSMYSNRFASLNAIAGLSFVGDIINNFQSDVYDHQFSFNYGVLGGMEAEFTASRSLSFVLSANQRYYVRKEFGNWRYQIGAAIRISL